MDPNETLKRLRELAEQPVSLDVCEEMQGYFNDLDNWLASDGFLPDAWKAEEDKPSACVEAGRHLKTETHGWYSCPAVTRVGS